MREIGAWGWRDGCPGTFPTQSARAHRPARTAEADSIAQVSARTLPADLATTPMRGDVHRTRRSSKSKPCQGDSLAGFLVLLASETLVVRRGIVAAVRGGSGNSCHAHSHNSNRAGRSRTRT